VITDKMEAQIVALEVAASLLVNHFADLAAAFAEADPGAAALTILAIENELKLAVDALQTEFPRQLGEGLCAEELLGHITRVLDGALTLARERMQTGSATHWSASR
jgi:hypothetical protein